MKVHNVAGLKTVQGIIEKVYRKVRFFWGVQIKLMDGFNVFAEGFHKFLPRVYTGCMGFFRKFIKV